MVKLQTFEMNNRYSVEEENLLAQVWVAVSKDVVKYNANSFWNPVVAMFNNWTEGVNRNKDMVSSKWRRLNCECHKFNAIYRQLRLTIGDNHGVCLMNALAIFKERYGGKSFEYVHVWEVLRNHPKWVK